MMLERCESCSTRFSATSELRIVLRLCSTEAVCRNSFFSRTSPSPFGSELASSRSSYSSLYTDVLLICTDCLDSSLLLRINAAIPKANFLRRLDANLLRFFYLILSVSSSSSWMTAVASTSQVSFVYLLRFVFLSYFIFWSFTTWNNSSYSILSQVLPMPALFRCYWNSRERRVSESAESGRGSAIDLATPINFNLREIRSSCVLSSMLCRMFTFSSTASRTIGS